VSAYGQLWEKVQALRQKLKHYIPGASADSLPTMLKERAEHTAKVDALLVEWAELEKQMERANDR
jgi:hypothetical protein